MNFKYSMRDLINAGIFSVLFIVVMFAIGMISILNPLLMFVTHPLLIIVNGTVFMLYLTRVKHAGMILLMGVLVSVVLLTGHSWTLIPVTAVCVLGAELVIWWGDYKSANKDILAYGIFSISMEGPLLPILYMPKAYFAGIAEEMNVSWAESMEKLFSPAVVIAMFGICFISGIIGAWLGKKMLHKHFERAGIA